MCPGIYESGPGFHSLQSLLVASRKVEKEGVYTEQMGCMRGNDIVLYYTLEVAAGMDGPFPWLA